MRQLMEMKQLAKEIGNIGRQKVTLDKKIQTIAIECVGQSIVHRNATPAMQLFEAVGTSSRRDTLVAFLEKFGNIAWMKSEKKLAFFDAGKQASDFSDEYVELMEGVAWHSVLKEPVPRSQYDITDEASKFITRMKKLAGDVGKQVKHADLIEQLYVTYATYVSNEALRNAKALPEEEQAEIVKQAVGATHQAEATTKPASPEAVAALAEHFGKPQVAVAA